MSVVDSVKTDKSWLVARKGKRRQIAGWDGWTGVNEPGVALLGISRWFGLFARTSMILDNNSLMAHSSCATNRNRKLCACHPSTSAETISRWRRQISGYRSHMIAGRGTGVP